MVWGILPIMKTASTLTEQALQLTPKRRARLAHVLIQSLDTEIDPDAEQLWNDEIARRVQDIEMGRVKGIPASKVFARRLRRKA
jgi:putative addiction module component (TIGR02574 family)